LSGAPGRAAPRRVPLPDPRPAPPSPPPFPLLACPQRLVVVGQHKPVGAPHLVAAPARPRKVGVDVGDRGDAVQGEPHVVVVDRLLGPGLVKVAAGAVKLTVGGRGWWGGSRGVRARASSSSPFSSTHKVAERAIAAGLFKRVGEGAGGAEKGGPAWERGRGGERGRHARPAAARAARRAPAPTASPQEPRLYLCLSFTDHPPL